MYLYEGDIFLFFVFGLLVIHTPYFTLTTGNTEAGGTWVSKVTIGTSYLIYMEEGSKKETLFTYIYMCICTK